MMLMKLNRDSQSTPTPSTTTEMGPQVSQQSSSLLQRQKSSGTDEGRRIHTSSSAAQLQPPIQPQYKRTLEDGPTTRQKLLVVFIWLCAAFFGVTTCFPDKVFGVEISKQIMEDQVSIRVESNSIRLQSSPSNLPELWRAKFECCILSARQNAFLAQTVHVRDHLTRTRQNYRKQICISPLPFFIKEFQKTFALNHVIRAR
jgi:hypothetical protein